MSILGGVLVEKDLLTHWLIAILLKATGKGIGKNLLMSMVIGKHSDRWPRKVTNESSSNRKSHHDSGNGKISTSIHDKFAFERDFPSLGAEERPVGSEIGSTSSPGLSNKSTFEHDFPSLGAEERQLGTSALADISVGVGSSGRGVAVASLNASAGSTPITATSLNMAEAVAQGPSCARTPPMANNSSLQRPHCLTPQTKSLYYSGGENRLLTIPPPTTTPSHLHFLPLPPTSPPFSASPSHLLSNTNFQITTSTRSFLSRSNMISKSLFPVGNGNKTELTHPKRESWFVDALSSTREGFGGESGEQAESIPLETSSSFGFISSSLSLSSLPPIELDNEDPSLFL
ncbi:Leucine-rich repeat protein kinase family protein [Hibiscus syriacus]|uniref:Leucine-rich repeat protein kinase family protein n=1 Tax=Hibiscus syriacus TaxID=106335 RepID=A0A6A2ZH86_HIBSY|nr:Leucine-rich repeat protein kinase family protein [Hibiscus syriacus]